MSPETKICQNCKQNFTIEPDDFGFYEKMDVPPPTWCPDCRMMRRMVFWNEHSFFRKIEKRTGKELLSTFPPQAPIEIYEREYWWSDNWDPMSCGKDPDFSRPLLAQMRELQLSVPWPTRAIVQSVNSEYSNNAADLKNCYLCFNGDTSEDCMYSVGINKLKGSLDIFRAEGSELCYESFGIFNSYQCFFSSVLVDCRNVVLSYNCNNCSDCFGCVNLRSKKFCIFNKQYSKEEYFAKLKEMNLGSYKELTRLQKDYHEFYLKFPRKFMTGFNNQNVSGDYIRSSKNVNNSYSIAHSENVKYTQSVLMGAKDTYDYTSWGSNVELTYEAQSCGESMQRIKFSWECYDGCSDIEYSMACISSSNLFACVGLRNKQYCIFNKQYSKEEYQALVPKLKKHMADMPYIDAQGRVYGYGEFFPPEFSFLAANESAVVDYVEMDKNKAEKYGFVWREAAQKEYQVTCKALDLPDHISEAGDTILKEIISCSTCQKGYRIIQGELEFLRRFSLPLPRQCFNCRNARRNNSRNKPVFYSGVCHCAGKQDRSGAYPNNSSHLHGEQKCPNVFQTSYAPDRPEIVYCEACYNAEIA